MFEFETSRFHHQIRLDFNPHVLSQRSRFSPEKTFIPYRNFIPSRHSFVDANHLGFALRKTPELPMKIFVCPKDWTFAKERFTPDHMVSLQNPGADVSELRPPCVAPENHYISFFYDADLLGDVNAPTREQISHLIDWLSPRCQPESAAQFLIHCDAGLGRSTAVGYIAWSLFLGPGREQEAFDAMKDSSFESKLVPNSIVIDHADDLLGRAGALRKPLTEWNQKVTWRRTFR